MRELIARSVLILALGVLTGLSLLFATLHNPVPPAEPVPEEGAPPALPVAPDLSNAVELDADEIDRGKTVYARQRCSTCHSIEGAGNTRSPLDGTGDQWDLEELRAWVTATDFVAELLPEPVVRRKQGYQRIPEPDMDALVRYLSTLKTEP